MTLIPHRGARSMTSLDAALAVVNRPSRFGEYLGAQVREGFWAGLGGQGLAWLRRLDADNGEPLDQQAWRDGPHWREGLDWDEGMTEGRARAMAEIFDENAIRRRLIANRNAGGAEMVLGFAAGVLGSVVDPINVVPVAGVAGRIAGLGRTASTALGRIGAADRAVRTAAAAQFGQVRGRALVAAAEGAAATAAIQPFLVPSRRAFGDEVTFGDALLDIAMGAGAGAVLGGAAGLVAWRANRVAGRARAEAVARVEEAADALARGQAIDLPPPSPAMRQGFNRAADRMRLDDRGQLADEAVGTSAAERAAADAVVRDVDTRLVARRAQTALGGEGSEPIEPGLVAERSTQQIAERDRLASPQNAAVGAVDPDSVMPEVPRDGGEADEALIDAGLEVEVAQLAEDGRIVDEDLNEFTAASEASAQAERLETAYDAAAACLTRRAA